MKKNIHDDKIDTLSVMQGALVFILPLLAIAIILTLTFYFSRTQASTNLSFSAEERTVNQQLNNITTDIRMITTDLRFLSSNMHLKSLLPDMPTKNRSNLSMVQQEFLQFSKAKSIYDQIRFLDVSGMETIRINFNAGDPSIVPSEKLQNKKGRYYFDDAFALNKDEIFVSPLDLNIENGQVEQPHKPMIRFAMPLYNLQNTKSGIVLLNYFGSYLLDRFKEQGLSSLGSSLLLNHSGYYLIGDSPDKEWGFMFPDQASQKKTFAHDHPEAWMKIIDSDRGQFETADGLFTYATAYPLNAGMKSSSGTGTAAGQSELMLDDNEYYWKIISFVPENILYAEQTKFKQVLWVFMLGFFSLIVLGSWKLSLSRYKHKQAEKKLKLKTQDLFDSNQKLERLAATDDLTGLANRRFAMQALNQLWEEKFPQIKPLACVLVDADHFKEINDTYGHDAGDIVLRELATQLKFSVRTDDIVCRLGGDEFLIICPNTDKEGLLLVAKKMHDHIENLIIKIPGGAWHGSISVGAAVQIPTMKNPEDLIKAADNGVYKAKKAGKNCVKVA